MLPRGGVAVIGPAAAPALPPGAQRRSSPYDAGSSPTRSVQPMTGRPGAVIVGAVNARAWGWSIRRDGLLPVGVAALQLAIAAGAGRHHPMGPDGGCLVGSCSTTHLDALAWVLLVLGPLALVGRRRQPRATLAAAFVIAAIYTARGYPAGPAFPALVVALARVVIDGDRSAAWVTVGLGWAVFLWLPAALGTGHAPGVVQAAGAAAWLLALSFGAEMLRSRRARLVAQRRTREEEGLRRAEEERLRIARELHDVLAHNISLINIQSGVALHLLSEQPEQARTALSVINEASADALREMRSVLGVLRHVDEQAPRAPAAGLDRLPDLVASAAAAGVTVQVSREGDARPLSTPVDLAAYRIVQESLTNVARHAGGGRATVTLSSGSEALTISVEDDGAGVALRTGANGHAADLGSGNGIAGMRERAVALGGELHAGPRPDGGFGVRARLPYGGRR